MLQLPLPSWLLALSVLLLQDALSQPVVFSGSFYDILSGLRVLLSEEVEVDFEYVGVLNVLSLNEVSEEALVILFNVHHLGALKCYTNHLCLILKRATKSIYTHHQ